VLVVGTVEIYLPLAGMVDVDAERIRFEKELAVTESQIERLEKLLGGDFANKAPAPVVAKETRETGCLQRNGRKNKDSITIES